MEQCRGSTLQCVARYGGPLGQEYALPQTAVDSESVIVGLAVYYVEPEVPPPDDYSSPEPFNGGNGDSGNGTAPSLPGSVYGIASITLATAQDVVVGNPSHRTNTYTFTPDPGFPPAGAETGTFVAEPGSAIYSFNVWFGPDGAQQIQAIYRPLRSGTGAEASTLSPKYPSALAPDSSATAQLVGCLGGGLFPYALAWNRAGVTGSLGKIQLTCGDFSPAFADTGTRAIQCCTGQQSQFCWGYAPQNEQCSVYFQDYCRPLCDSNGNCADPICGCVASPVAMPQCIDARCAEVPSAYRLQGELSTDDCPNTVTCDQYKALGNGAHVARGISVPSDCLAPVAGNPLLEWVKKNVLLSVAIFFFLLIVVIAILTGGSTPAARRAAKLPPLPPLQAFS